MKHTIFAALILILSACGNTPSKETIFSITKTELAELKLSYYSDYFSFVGWDERGAVSFAIDNNRGQDGATWQADHFLVLHDEKMGWQDVKGNGLYKNINQQLDTIPDSKFFDFKGSPKEGLLINSKENQLTLRIEPINIALTRKKGLSRFEIGTAAATLNWKGRTINGRIIHEYLFLPAFNRLSRMYMGIFNDFHGVYAVLNRSEGDFYFHRQKSEFISDLTGGKIALLINDNHTTVISELPINITSRSLALGLYRWPDGWVSEFPHEGKMVKFSLKPSQPNIIANWFLGGFSMNIITGELTLNDKVFQVYGLGELIL